MAIRTSWIDDVRIADAVARLREVPSGARLLDELRVLPTKLAFERAPTAGPVIASYTPARNRLLMPFESTLTADVVLDGALVHRMPLDEEAITLAHEGTHRAQFRNRLTGGARAITEPFAAVLAGVRELARRSESPELSAGQRAARAFDRRMFAPETEAFAMEQRITRELAGDRTWVSMDEDRATAFTEHGPDYRKLLRIQAGVSVTAVTVGGGYLAYRQIDSALD